MKVSDFLRMSDAEIRVTFDKPVGTCLYGKCGKPVMNSEEKRYVPNGVYHTDCYFAEWGEEVEAHPICHPGRRGVGAVMLDESDLAVMAGAQA